MKSRMLYYLEYLLVQGTIVLANLLPLRLSYWIAKRIGDLSYLVMVKRRKVALENLSRAYGDRLSSKRKKEIARCSFEHVALSIAELFTIPSILKNAAERFSFKGIEHLDAAFKKGKGVIWVISHLGSWEYLAFFPYLRKFPCSVVVKSLKNVHVDRVMNQFREMTLLRTIPKKYAARKILYEIRKNHLVSILIDQWAGREGVWADFFGYPTSTTSIPIRIAQRTGCALVPAQCVRTAPGSYQIEIMPEVRLDNFQKDWEVQTTLELNRLMESQILKYPEQWTWGHRRWKTKPHNMSVNPASNISG